ncbi:Rv0361 family membrane protein [Actinocatenispora rupis]|uniref:Rv0361 family membrane protein n=1 Tax=Actinocatenispora rupis TaxID=519421 RepID=UPI00194546B7|nr:hypothetical protein [Actinocatenispora rupis]
MPPQAPAVPEPPTPRGPGVVVPFAAPPRERNPRIWIGVIVLCAVVLLCGGGGIAGFIGFTVYETNQVSDTADRFLTALQDQRFAAAYQMQCRQARAEQTQQEFVDELSREPKLDSHTLDAPEALQSGSSAYVVPAQLRFADGQDKTERIVVVSEAAASGGSLKVCGVA